jgi:hypothetical protein
MTNLEPVGNYAVKPTFDDGHNSGLYTWDYLYDLGARLEQHWADYLKRLAAAGFSGDAGREPGAVLPGAPAKAQGCGHHHLIDRPGRLAPGAGATVVEVDGAGHWAGLRLAHLPAFG